MNEILEIELFSNKISAYISSLILLIILIFIFRIFKEVIIKYLKHLADKSDTKYDNYLIDAILELKWPFYLILALYISIQSLVIPKSFQLILELISIISIAYYLSKAIIKFIELVVKDLNSKVSQEDRVDESVIDLALTMIRVVIIIIAIVTVLTNLGIDTTTLITGLGIGGIAIAFALQKIMEDIFAFFMIHIDKPIKKGEFIAVGNYAGVVEKIGLKSTRIRSRSGEEIIVANKDLLNSWINNYGRIVERRYLLKIGVKYDTPADKLEKIPQIIKEEILSVSSEIKIYRVHFTGYGDWALLFEAYLGINKSDYSEYLDIVQRINLNIKRKFDKEGIEFAFPSQSLYIEKLPNNKL